MSIAISKEIRKKVMKIVLDVYYNRRKSIIGIKNICGTVSEEI